MLLVLEVKEIQLPSVLPHCTEPKSMATQLISTLLSAGFSEIERRLTLGRGALLLLKIGLERTFSEMRAPFGRIKRDFRKTCVGSLPGR